MKHPERAGDYLDQSSAGNVVMVPDFAASHTYKRDGVVPHKSRRAGYTTCSGPMQLLFGGSYFGSPDRRP
jgi:hypothetical protein